MRRLLSVGTRSVLFGAHCWFLHPWFVAWAWWTLYGASRVQIPYRRAVDAWAESPDPAVRARGAISVAASPPRMTSILDPRLWVAFFVHDLGYVGKPNMDGAEGETHAEWGARLMGRLFGREWELFTLLHSRYYAKRRGRPFSALCVADKLAIALTPAWLYLPLVRATGEIDEYMTLERERHRHGERMVEDVTFSDVVTRAEQRACYLRVQSYCRRWAWEHRDGRLDTWTAVIPREDAHVA